MTLLHLAHCRILKQYSMNVIAKISPLPQKLKLPPPPLPQKLKQLLYLGNLLINRFDVSLTPTNAQTWFSLHWQWHSVSLARPKTWSWWTHTTNPGTLAGTSLTGSLITHSLDFASLVVTCHKPTHPLPLMTSTPPLLSIMTCPNTREWWDDV